MKNQVIGVNTNPLNANVHLGDIEVLTVASAVDHHHLIKRKDAIVQAVHVPLVVHQAVVILEVLVLAAVALAVLNLAVVQSLDLHPYLGDGGHLAF